MKKINFLVVFIFCLFFLFGWVNSAKALISLIGDELTMGGFLRSQYDFNVGHKNPALLGAKLIDDKLDSNLFRTMLQVELKYTPTDTFNFYTKIRAINDSTQEVNSDNPEYNAFPTKFDNDWTLLRVSSDHNALEVWELYTNINLGKNLWLRLGRQQVVWGEMIGGRILDIVNPLDNTWHMFWEPEEFENVRIPIWAIRGAYSIPTSFIKQLTLEGVINPGDVVPNQNPPLGSPLTLFVLPAFLRITDDDIPRGKLEYGGRLTGMIGEVRFCLVYYSQYSDSGITTSYGIIPDPVNGIPLLAPFSFTKYSILERTSYPRIHSYGGSFDWYWEMAKTVINGEFVYTPNFPYNSSKSTANIEDMGTAKWGIKVSRPTRILPSGFDFASLSLQFVQTYRKGDPDDILINNAKADKHEDAITFLITQTLAHQQVEVNFGYTYDLEGAYWLRSYLKLKKGNNWVFQVGNNMFGGSKAHPGRLSAFNWANEVYSRLTYQF